MKRIILFFAVCLGLSVSQTTFAADAETVRAATKRGQTTTVSGNVNSGTNTNRPVSSNANKTEQIQNAQNARTATRNTPQQRVVSRNPVTQQQNVKQRNATTKQIVQTTNTPSVKSRTASTRTVTDTRKTVQNTGTKSVRSATGNKKQTSRAAAVLNVEKMAEIKAKNFSKCKTVYFECMDEFCANKDADLRRCACSSRIHEFDNIKKQLSEAEDKMLDFNQRLLTVSLDKEDAAAISVATEGETAYNVKDRTESEKLLQKITKTLNTSGDSRLNNNLSAISLSLDIDSAFDGVDSLAGMATTSKNGLDLYNAARPICVEMANEVCTKDELNVAQNSYKLTIQQDCETVAKSYSTLYNQAQEKIFESGALLDMSRLNVYQQRNSDDTLTCKKKILTQLSDDSVCGENLYKCLDVTGQYINPLNGSAFLSTDLINLTKVLQEPDPGEKWSTLVENENFVKFLNSKKEFLEPAIEQCQDIADVVWQDFLEDALAQIKLAQNAKLEEIRQSCTQLIAECKTNALNDLTELDPRALSTFNVVSDKTANLMCKDIEDSCTALMNDIDEGNNWNVGVTGIATDITYDKIIESCTDIGRDCIIRQCNGTSGNFALCQNITDDKRREILQHQTCWDEVLDCVASADNLDNMKIDNTDNTNIENDEKTIEEIITEQIWGKCVDGDNKTKKISIPDTGSTLLSWFAQNTGTMGLENNCDVSGCPVGYTLTNGECVNNALAAASKTIHVTSTHTNECEDGVLDTFGNCCLDGYTSNGICVPENYTATLFQTARCTGQSIIKANSNVTNTDANRGEILCPGTTKRKIALYCLTEDNSTPITRTNTNNDDTTITYTCAGNFILVDEYGNYLDVPPNTNYIKYSDYQTGYIKTRWVEEKYLYKNEDNEDTVCVYHGYGFVGDCRESIPNPPTDNEFLIEYPKNTSNDGNNSGN